MGSVAARFRHSVVSGRWSDLPVELAEVGPTDAPVPPNPAVQGAGSSFFAGVVAARP
jgi:hypothetical protein